MAHTTLAKVEAMLQETFTDTSKPTATEITDTIIPWSDGFVDKDTIQNTSALDREILSTVMASHVISTQREIDFSAGDVTIRPTKRDSAYLNLYKTFSSRFRTALFKKAND